VPPGLITLSTVGELKFTVPQGAVTGPISVTTVDGTGQSATSLTVQQPPQATQFFPGAGPVGTAVTIYGTNLTGATSVTFGASGTPVVPTNVTSFSLQAIVPADATTGPVSITNPVGTGTSASSFKVTPKITGFTPGVAALESTVVVNGSNLKTGGSDPVVKIGTVAATVVASSPSQVSFTVPLLAVTGPISITTADGTATSASALTVTP
jgi:hypothetical protein